MTRRDFICYISGSLPVDEQISVPIWTTKLVKFIQVSGTHTIKTIETPGHSIVFALTGHNNLTTPSLVIIRVHPQGGIAYLMEMTFTSKFSSHPSFPASLLPTCSGRGGELRGRFNHFLHCPNLHSRHRPTTHNTPTVTAPAASLHTKGKPPTIQFLSHIQGKKQTP